MRLVGGGAADGGVVGEGVAGGGVVGEGAADEGAFRLQSSTFFDVEYFSNLSGKKSPVGGFLKVRKVLNCKIVLRCVGKVLHWVDNVLRCAPFFAST